MGGEGREILALLQEVADLRRQFLRGSQALVGRLDTVEKLIK